MGELLHYISQVAQRIDNQETMRHPRHGWTIIFL
jgi:hypothetical protein